MPRPVPDPASGASALRALVAEIASRTPADIDAILAELDAADRARVRAMLGVSGNDAASPVGVIGHAHRIADLPPWLALRMRDGGEGSDIADGTVTQATRTALQDAVKGLLQRGELVEAPQAGPGPTLLSRLWALAARKVSAA